MPKRYWMSLLLLPVVLLLTACPASGKGGGIPPAPASFTATAESPTSVRLTWSRVANATAYVLDRRAASGEFAFLTLLGPDDRSFTDSGVSAASSYEYRISARNSFGTGAPRTVAVTTPPAGSGDGTGDGDGDGDGDGNGSGSAGFSFSLQPATLALPPGGKQGIPITLVREQGFAEPVTFTLEGAISGSGAERVQGVFTPNPAASRNSELMLTVGADVPVGRYALTVRAASGKTSKTAALTLEVVRARVLLVDDDRSNNNYNPAQELSASDIAYRAALDALEIHYDVAIVPASADGPGFEQLTDYETVIWYTGEEYYTGTYTISSTDQLTLQAFLDQGDRKLVLSSPGMLADAWNHLREFTGEFHTGYLGITQAYFDYNNGSVNLQLAGVPGQATADLNLAVAADRSGVRAHSALLLPAAGTVTLLTRQFDPGDLAGQRAMAVATGRKLAVAGADDSTLVFLGFPLENVVSTGANTIRGALQQLLAF
jgi:hypothetical protein